MKRRPNCECKICGTQIYRRPVHIAAGSVYCSLRCCGISQQIPRVCPVCTTSYVGLKRTCSRKCANQSRAGISYTGANAKNKAYQGILLKQKLAHARNGICEACGEPNYAILQVHHIKERHRGGTNAMSNLRLLCPNCHATHHLGVSLFLGSRDDRVLQQRPKR